MFTTATSKSRLRAPLHLLTQRWTHCPWNPAGEGPQGPQEHLQNGGGAGQSSSFSPSGSFSISRSYSQPSLLSTFRISQVGRTGWGVSLGPVCSPLSYPLPAPWDRWADSWPSSGMTSTGAMTPSSRPCWSSCSPRPRMPTSISSRSLKGARGWEGWLELASLLPQSHGCHLSAVSSQAILPLTSWRSQTLMHESRHPGALVLRT